MSSSAECLRSSSSTSSPSDSNSKGRVKYDYPNPNWRTNIVPMIAHIIGFAKNVYKYFKGKTRKNYSKNI